MWVSTSDYRMVVIITPASFVKTFVVPFNRTVQTRGADSFNEAYFMPYWLVWPSTDGEGGFLTFFSCRLLNQSLPNMTRRQFCIGKLRRAICKNTRVYNHSAQKWWIICKSASTYSIVSINDWPSLWIWEARISFLFFFFWLEIYFVFSVETNLIWQFIH